MNGALFWQRALLALCFIGLLAVAECAWGTYYVEGDFYGGSVYNDFFGAGFIDLAKHKPWRLAGTIVHELTHAYLHGRWQVPYRGELKERHERVCLKEELRLYRRLIAAFNCDEDEGRAWLEWVERSHQGKLARRWWERSRWDAFRRSWRAFREREKERESGKA